jgi:hypothetical protein
LFAPSLGRAQTISIQAGVRTKFCQDYGLLRVEPHAPLNSLAKHKASL